MKKFLFLTLLLLMVLPFQIMANEVYFLNVNGVITDATHKFIKNGIDEASTNSAKAVVIKLDTPGGILSSTKNIVQEIFESKIPVVVFVSPQGAEAGSAGTFITLAADYAIMTDSSRIGAAHPVSITGGNIDGDMQAKVMNSTESFMRAIAEKRNRNIIEAVLTVTESKSFTAVEAKEAGIIDDILNSDEEVLQMLQTKLNIETPLKRVTISPTITERISFGLSDPNVLMLLFFFAALMIFLEIKAPGTFIFAGLGIVAIIIFLFGAHILPINFLGILVMLIGVALLVAELFIASFGLLAVAGIVSMVVGMRLLFDTMGVQGVKVSMSLTFTVALTFVAVTLILGKVLLKDRGNKVVNGLDALLGKDGTVLIWGDGGKKVMVNGEYWNAQSDDELIKGDKVTVSHTSGLLLTVIKINKLK